MFNNGSGNQMCTAYKFSKQKYAHQAKYKQGTYQAANENFHHSEPSQLNVGDQDIPQTGNKC